MLLASILSRAAAGAVGLLVGALLAEAFLLVPMFRSVPANPGLYLGMIGIYFAFFKDANQGFAERRLSDIELAHVLSRWERWHAVRTAIGVMAFACALMAIV